MAKHLTNEASEQILNNPKLYVDVCDILDIKPASLPKFIERKSDRLTKYEVVIAIAAAMNIEPDDVLIDDEIPEPQNDSIKEGVSDLISSSTESKTYRVP